MTDMDTRSSERKPARRTKAKTTAPAEEGAARRKGAKSPRSKESPAPAAAHEGDSGGAYPSRDEPEPGAARYDDAQWHAKVAELAYLRAERRGFVNGSPDQDWLEAEEELRCELQASASAGSDQRAG